MDKDGNLVVKAPSFTEKVTVSNWNKKDNHWICEIGDIEKYDDRLKDIYSAIMIGLRDYVNKNHFPGAIIGMSGGWIVR